MIAVIDGCGTNIASILFALERLNKKYELTSEPEKIKAASHIIIPGVSTAKRALEKLQEKRLKEVLKQCQQPVLGICSGMQILFSWCAEGEVSGLNIFPEKVNLLQVHNLPLPHMGWNTLKMISSGHFLLEGLNEKDYVYFVHSFAAPVGEYTVASCTYSMPFSAIIAKNNFYGTQFHPERSGKVGARILSNFLQSGY